MAPRNAARRRHGSRLIVRTAVVACLLAALAGVAAARPCTAAATTKPVLTVQPSDRVAKAGSTVTFAAYASGDPKPSVQWLMSTGGPTWIPITGATGETLKIKAKAAVSGYAYKAVFTSVAGRVYSRRAALVVKQSGGKPAVTAQPISLKVATGTTATFSAAATGTPVPTVQWQQSQKGSAWVPIAGATKTSLSIATVKAQSGTKLRALFTNVNGQTYSKTAALVVVDATKAPLVTKHPVSLSLATGQSATFTAAASGDPTPKVQWQVSQNGQGYAAISGATSTTYTVQAAASLNGNRYRAVFSNASGKATSDPAVLKVDAKVKKPKVVLQPTDQSVYAEVKATFTAGAAAASSAKVQWQVSVKKGQWTNISGATKATFAVKADTSRNGNRYRAVFTDSAGSATTAPATLTILSSMKPVVTLNPVTQTALVGGQPVFWAAAIGRPDPKLQWQESANGTTWTNISGATTGLYYFAATMAQFGYKYRALFTNSAGSTATTTAALTVVQGVTKPVINVQPADEVLATDVLATFHSSAVGGPTPSAQWQYSTDGVNWADIPGATGTTYQALATTTMNGWQLRCVFTNTTASVTSDPAKLTVLTAPIVLVQPASQSGKVPATVSFTCTAMGTPTPTVQWQQSSDGTTWTDIPDATAATLSVAVLGDEKFRAVYTNSGGQVISGTATFTMIK